MGDLNRERDRARCEYRGKLLYDLKLSAPAYRLYCLLDDIAGRQGRCWPSQFRLLKFWQLSKRMFFYYLDELKTAGYIKISREGRRNIYELQWVQPIAPIAENRCNLSHEQVQQVAPETLLPLYEPGFEPGVCSRCTGRGWGVWVNHTLSGDKPTVFLCGCEPELTLGEARRRARAAGAA